MTKIDINDYNSPLTGLLGAPTEIKATRVNNAKSYAAEGMTMHVSSSGVWTGSFPDIVSNKPNCITYRTLQSYERIAFHSGSEWFLEAFLTAGGKVIFHGFRGIEGEVTL